MREILFRGKAINRNKGYHRTKYKNGDWVYGLLTRLYDELYENLPAEMTNTNGVSGIEIDHKTVGQYTGLTDKNGTKIFEGDVILYDEEYGHIEYDDLDAEFILSFDTWVTTFGIVDSRSVEVIGNIHDNPQVVSEVGDEGW